jgi:hypothetical protein
MKCQRHGWKYGATNRYRFFCSLCRDLEKLQPEEREHINNWLTEHEELLTTKSVSVYSLEALYLQLSMTDPDEHDSRVCITGINRGSIRSAALKYGLAPSMVHRVRLDLSTEGTRVATERLLNCARRKLRESEPIVSDQNADLAAD